MSICETLNFQPMLITDVFETLTASKSWYDKSALNTKGVPSFPFVSRTKSDNGVDGFCARQEKDPEPGGAITIGLDTQTVGYQPVPFYTSQNIQVLRHPRLTLANATVLMTVIAVQLRKFSWGGNGATLGRLKATKIMVPVTVAPDGETVVDWDGMTAFGEELLAQVQTHTHRARPSDAEYDGECPELRFEPMLITDLFAPHKGKRLIKDHREDGSTPFIGGSEFNNSITGFSKVTPLYPGGWLTVVYNGSVGRTRFQPVPFFPSDDVIALEPLNSSATFPALIVLATAIERVCVSKFSYGTKLNLARLKATKIMVPVTHTRDGSCIVDWDGMEQYGRWLISRVCNRMDEVIGGDSS